MRSRLVATYAFSMLCFVAPLAHAEDPRICEKGDFQKECQDWQEGILRSVPGVGSALDAVQSAKDKLNALSDKATQGIVLWAVAYASDWVAARVPVYKPIHDDWLWLFLLGAMLCGIALYVYRRWGNWHPSARWFFMAVAWPIIAFALLVVLEQIGLKQLTNNDTFVYSSTALGVVAFLGMSIYAGRELWQRKATAP